MLWFWHKFILLKECNLTIMLVTKYAFIIYIESYYTNTFILMHDTIWILCLQLSDSIWWTDYSMIRKDIFIILHRQIIYA